MHFLKHLAALMAEFKAFAWQHKAWWVIPMVVVMFMLGLLIVVGQGAAPFIYTLF
jgi:hypothetical protein